MKNFILFFILFSFFGYSQCVTSTTWDGSAWSNGVPDASINVLIDGLYDTGNDGSIDCCTLTVNAGANLTVSIGDYCNVSGHINVIPTGILNVKSGGSLIPISSTCIATGNINVERRTPSTKRFDYTYWSSPVATTIGTALLPTKWESNWTFTFNTPNFYDIETTYWGTYISALPDGQDDNNDAWTRTNVANNMIAGKGYASMVKSIPAAGIYPRTEIVTFTGPLNTGTINIPLSLSGNTLIDVDDFNLVGNPYSSAINSNDFIDTNISSTSGTLYFWTHSNTLTTSYTGLAMYNFSTNDYAKYTKLGGVTAVFGGKKPTNVIGSCQGFFVEAETTDDLIFLPSFMSKAYVNTTAVAFFRESEQKKPRNLWLNMANADGLFSQQLIGYNKETDLSYNKGWDSRIVTITQIMKFYSVENNTKYDIQARGKWDDDDLVHLGYTSAISGDFTISVDSKEGRMQNQDVYLYDSLFNSWHDLSEPYTFNTLPGEFNTRFFIQYEEPEDDEEDEDDHKLISSNHIDVYNMQGIKIDSLSCWCFDDLPKNQIFILKIHSGNKTKTIKYAK